MRQGLSLKWVIGAGTSLVLVASLFVYVQAVLNFSQHALDYITSYMMEEEALYFSKRYEQDPSTSLPHGPAFKAVIGQDALPEHVRVQLQSQAARIIGSLQIFDDPPSTYIQTLTLHDGKTLYLFDFQQNRDTHAEHRFSEEYWNSKVQELLWIVLSVPAAALVLIMLLVYRIISPLRRLIRWSATVGNPTSEPVARPGFSYREFNVLAASLSDSVNRVKSATLREKRLLRYTSHELRTPLAVLKANVQLLEIRGELCPSLKRIQRSVRDMQGITETLLWMSSDHSKVLAEADVDMALLLEELLEDNHYLMHTRQITLMLRVQHGPYPLPVNACRIVIGNLLRNALQYADQGCVELVCNPQTLTIVNRIAHTATQGKSADYGYGLGLELVRLLCEKLGWHLHQHSEAQYYTVRLMFAANKQPQKI